jgi:F0F1-type ATP synthase epsilon subunit
MVQYKGNFKCIILSPNDLIFEEEVQSIFLTGDRGEYELLAYHYTLLGVLKQSDIIINWNKKVSIRGGVVRFFANVCIIMVEEAIKGLNSGRE